MAEGDNRVLREYALPQALGITSSIITPAIKANNFGLNPVLITSVEWELFSEYPSDNPNGHLCKFLARCDTIKLNGVSVDTI